MTPDPSATRPDARRFRSTPTRHPRDRGRELGGALAPLVRANLQGYRAMWDALRPGYDPLGDGAAALAATEAFAPNLAEEMRGIAEGADLDPRLVGALNARTEILALLGARAHECSAVVALPASGPPAAVQTWDWFGRFQGGWIVWEIDQADGRVVHTLTEAGIVGKAGVARGSGPERLGLLFTILHHRLDGARVGLPVHVAARAALDEGSLSGALQRLDQARVTASSSLTLVSWDGARSEAASVELSPAGPVAVRPEAGLLVRTNHFLDPGRAQGDTGRADDGDTLERRDRLARLPRDASADDILRAMDDHPDAAVCCHPPPGADPADEYATLATLTLDLAAGTLDAHPGGPCTHPWRLA